MGNQQGGPPGGPGGFGRGRRGPTDEEREAERKRRMEERKSYYVWFGFLLFIIYREETLGGWSDARRSQKEEKGC